MSALMIVQGVRVTLIAIDVLWALYLLILPASEFVTSPVWREAHRLLPWHSFVVLGFAFLAGPVLAAGAVFYSTTHRVGRAAYRFAGFALALTGACWGLVAVSFAAAASTLGGVGAGSAAIAGGLVVLHGLLAFEKHPQLQLQAQVAQRIGGDGETWTGSRP